MNLYFKFAVYDYLTLKLKNLKEKGCKKKKKIKNKKKHEI